MAIIGCASAAVTFRRDSGVSQEWRLTSKSPSDAVIPLMFAVQHRNMDKLYAFVDQVSDPQSPFYGQYLSLSELGEMVGNPEATATLTNYLTTFPLEDMDTTPNGDFVSVKVTVATAEAMLSTSFFQYSHESADAVIHRCDSYTLPDDVADAVNTVYHTTSLRKLGTTSKPFITSLSLRGTAAAGQSTPPVIQKYYGIDNPVVSNKAATISVFETIGQSYSPSDLTKFCGEYSIDCAPVAKVIGPNDPSSCSNPNNCVEAELDVQVVATQAQQAAMTFWSIPGTESFAQWFAAVAKDPTPPLTFSVSYGEDEKEVGKSNAETFNQEVAKMAARGLSVLIASGDDGVAGAGARSNKGACGFNPSYPATCPYVTAVGGTQGPEEGSAEIACQSNKGGGITSGGGFSTIFDRPSYQSSAVESYLSNGPSLPPKSDFASTGRGYPDVAAMAHNYPIVVDGTDYAGSGTSASTPLFASMVALANSARISAGKSPLGFLNPFIYQNSAIFHDITSGVNNCAAGGSVCCEYGFTATTGWDPITGVGSFAPFSAFLKAAMDA